MKEKLLAIPIRILFILLAMALIYTQVIKHSYYSKLSKDNAIRIIPIESSRGTIFDRNGVPLVSDRISFNAAIVYQELENKEKLIRLLVNTLGIKRSAVEDGIKDAARRPYVPVVIVDDIDRNKAFTLEEESFDVRGLVIQTKSMRHYIYKNIGAHVFGYLSQISESELENMKEYGYRAKDLVGRDGIEKYYNSYLSGIDGGIQVQVDNRGRQVKTLGLREPINGKNLYLTMDIKLQSVCDKALESKRGAIIVMNPNTGEVLALSSRPGFDPNVFVRPNLSGERIRLIRDKKMYPLLNRAISGIYQPGSIFKIIVALAALETGLIDRQTRFNCSGSFTLGTGHFKCWKEDGHNSQNVVDALMNSCNVFFYNAGVTVGVEKIKEFAKLFGFGRPTGIDLPNEAKGIVPGRFWKKVVKKDNWYQGDTVNYAIGQGFLLVTPIQILEMISEIANNGKTIRPYIVKRIGVTDVRLAPRRDLNLSVNGMKIVKTGLYKVINAEIGTGKRAKLEDVVVGGKTGTAQNPGGETHAWFTGFAPVNDAKISLVVFLEHGGKGGLEASVIAKEIFGAAKSGGYL